MANIQGICTGLTMVVGGLFLSMISKKLGIVAVVAGVIIVLGSF